MTRAILIHNTAAGMIVTAPSPPTRDGFRAKAKVLPGTYACTLVDRFYEFLCGRALDVRREYEEYYRPEYPTMMHFLYHKYGLLADQVEALQPFIEKDTYLGLVHRSWGHDWQMQSFLEHCETGIAAMMSAVGVEWAENRDED